MKQSNDQLARFQQGVYGVLGYRISYSQSPMIFRQVFDALNWPAVYARFDISPKGLKPFVAAAANAGIVGFNVTQPYKVKILDLLDTTDRTAKAVGAVNTVSIKRSRLMGSNTDVDGVEAALAPFRRELRQASVVILGAGGAARAAAYVLDRTFKVHDITVAVRSVAKGRKFINDVQGASGKQSIIAISSLTSPILRDVLSDATLLVNATPLGGTGLTRKSPLPSDVILPRSLIVFDLVYRPRPTLLLRRAQSAGCRTVDGWPMLIGQADAAFRRWTGRPFPIRVRQDLLAL